MCLLTGVILRCSESYAMPMSQGIVNIEESAINELVALTITAIGLITELGIRTIAHF